MIVVPSAGVTDAVKLTVSPARGLAGEKVKLTLGATATPKVAALADSPEPPSANSAHAARTVALVRLETCRPVIVLPPQPLWDLSHPRSTSMRSALTTSRPLPQLTLSRWRLRTSMVSLPGPPETRLEPWPARSLSLPAPPERTSLPLPPDRTSLPAPPLSVSLPLLPNSWSAPAPPRSVSLPVKPVRRSLPRPPDSRSLLDPPLRRSLPAPP